jgi:hypothetical protein
MNTSFIEMTDRSFLKIANFFIVFLQQDMLGMESWNTRNENKTLAFVYNELEACPLYSLFGRVELPHSE